jgi:predicted HAD superfamily Cof-like phosphohydrolase
MMLFKTCRCASFVRSFMNSLRHTAPKIMDDDSEHTLKELADLVFVCYQYAVARGWNLDIAMARVFESNMSKFVDGKPLRREDGKILKGPNYQPPSLTDLL